MSAQGFTHILIPVDFTGNTETSVQKAIELVSSNGLISLLHVLPDNEAATELHAENEMNVLKEMIIEATGDISVETYINPGGNLPDVITGYSKIIRPDLIIVARKKVRRVFRFLYSVSPHELSERSGCPVLSLKTNSRPAPIRTIVVYISSKPTVPNLEPLRILSNRFRVKVYLVAFNQDDLSRTMYTSGFLQIFQWLKSTLHCQVECCILNDQNRSKALATFGRKIDADILLIQSAGEKKETWINASIPDHVHSCSEIQVLSVQ